MNVATYLQNKASRLAQEPKHRSLCLDCRQPGFACYCAHVKPFDPRLQFVILIHPVEAFKRIATGRMAHLVLKNSKLIMGHDYTENTEVNSILKDSRNECVVLSPGPRSRNLSRMSELERSEVFDPEKIPTVFVIDGTWRGARKMMHLSQNLKTLPRIQFDPFQASRFRVRKQPRENFVSTIEAIHHAIELLGPGVGFQTQTREHDHLLNVFDRLVEQQLSLSQNRQHRKRLRNPA